MIFFINNNKSDNQSNCNYAPPSLFGLIIILILPVIINVINNMYIEPNTIYSQIFSCLGFIAAIVDIVYAVVYIVYQITK